MNRRARWCLLSAPLLGIWLIEGSRGQGVAHATKGSILQKTKFHLRRLTCKHEITEEAHKVRRENGFVHTFCINCGEHVKARSHYIDHELFNFIELEGGLSLEKTDELRKALGKK